MSTQTASTLLLEKLQMKTNGRLDTCATYTTMVMDLGVEYVSDPTKEYQRKGAGYNNSTEIILSILELPIPFYGSQFSILNPRAFPSFSTSCGARPCGTTGGSGSSPKPSLRTTPSPACPMS